MFETGQLVNIREQKWEVVEDRTSGGGEDHLLLVQGAEDANRTRKLTFVYHPGADRAEAAEQGVEHIVPEPEPELVWPPNAVPSSWERLHTAYRLSIAHRADCLLSLARARLTIEPYQLEPVLRIMNAPRQRFLLAEDVGMGKTIEAGLVMMELMARGRADRVLVVVPAALQDQWEDELFDKFGLNFQIIDNETLVKDILPGLKPGANPWNYRNHVITSIDFAKQDRIARALKNTYWDLVVIDEAHYLSESGTPLKPMRTDRSRFGEMIAGTCENLLLLTATPHNGYAQGFYSLLRLLDDTRFPSPERLEQDAVQEVMIRRSKHDIYESDGVTPKFIKRQVEHISLDITDPSLKAENQFYKALIRYANRQWKAAGRQNSQRVIIGFTMTLLKKRFISSPEAIRISLKTRLEKLGSEPADSKSRYFQAGSQGMPRTERELKRQHDIVVTQTIARDEPALEQERKEVGRLVQLAEQITPEKDFKAATLKAKLDEFRAQNRKVIVFTEYKDTLDYLQKYLSERGYAGQLVLLHGAMNRGERIAAERRFHEKDVWVLLATDAASEGLNFQRDCSTIIHYELPWNPNRLEQRNGRVDRWGQHKQVQIFNMVLEGTLEAHIQQRLAQKLENIRASIGKISDVLSPSDVLSIAEEMHLEDLEQRLMDAAEELGEEPTQMAFQEMADRIEAELDARLEKAKQQQQEWLASMSVAQTIFRAEHYQRMALRKQETEAVVPHDKQLETFVLETLDKLGGSSRRVPGDEPIWRLEIPASLRAKDVQPIYERATFDSEVARNHLEHRKTPEYLEFISLGHPLLENLIALVKIDARQDRRQLTGRLALRVLADGTPGLLFTFLARWMDGRGRVIEEEVVPFFLPLEQGKLSPEQARQEADRLLGLEPIRRNVPEQLLNTRYQPHWQVLREQARDIARAWCQQQALRVREKRLPQMEILERDLTTWAEARESWVSQQLERRLAQEAAPLQPSLLDYQELQRKQQAAENRAANDLAREKKIIENRTKERSDQIAQMKQILASEPEMLGALVIVPQEEF